MPRLGDLKETALYVDDLERAKRFYLEVMGLQILIEVPARFCALDVSGRHVLLLFVRGSCLAEAQMPGGTIPPHDGAGPAHVGFSIAAEELAAWEAQFERHGVAITGRIKWPLGGDSIYFSDPDGHLLELLTPGVWTTY